MTKDQAIHYMLNNPNCHVWHPLFSPNEFLFAKEDGIIYDECGYVFEDFEENSSRAGMRLRWEDVWLSGWRVTLGPDPELGDDSTINVLHRLLGEWGLGCYLNASDMDDLVKYLASNGVTTCAKEI